MNHTILYGEDAYYNANNVDWIESTYSFVIEYVIPFIFNLIALQSSIQSISLVVFVEIKVIMGYWQIIKLRATISKTRDICLSVKPMLLYMHKKEMLLFQIVDLSTENSILNSDDWFKTFLSIHNQCKKTNSDFMNTLNKVESIYNHNKFPFQLDEKNILRNLNNILIQIKTIQKNITDNNVRMEKLLYEIELSLTN